MAAAEMRKLGRLIELQRKLREDYAQFYNYRENVPSRASSTPTLMKAPTISFTFKTLV